MRTIKYFFFFVILSFLFFFVPTNSISKPLLYGESTDEGPSPVIDPICMVTVLEIVSYCPMHKQDSTGSVCTCHNQLRTFSGFVLTRLEYAALCRSWPQGSCSSLDPEPEFLYGQNEASEFQSNHSSPSNAFAGETTSTEDEPSVQQSDNATELPEDSAEQIASRHFALGATPASIPSSPSELNQNKINFEEILNKHPLRKFKKPSILEIITGEKKLN